jgi:hypothetical protein
MSTPQKLVFLFNYSHIVPANMAASIGAFVQATDLSVSLVQGVAIGQGAIYNPNQKKDEALEQGAIYLFKMGAIQEQDFYERMKVALGASLSAEEYAALDNKLDYETFVRCWNAMSTLQPSDWVILADIARLKAIQGFQIGVSANTNSLHRAWIAKQLSEKYSDLIDFAAYSYEVGRFDPEPAVPLNAEIKDHCHSKEKANSIISAYVATIAGPAPLLPSGGPSKAEPTPAASASETKASLAPTT